jgi:replicative superfamily II helicase
MGDPIMATIIQLLRIISQSANQPRADRQYYRQALTQLIAQMQSSNQIWQPTSQSLRPEQAAEQASYYAEALATTWPELSQNARQLTAACLTATCLYDWFNHRLQVKMLQRSLALNPTMKP